MLVLLSAFSNGGGENVEADRRWGIGVLTEGFENKDTFYSNSGFLCSHISNIPHDSAIWVTYLLRLQYMMLKYSALVEKQGSGNRMRTRRGRIFSQSSEERLNSKTFGNWEDSPEKMMMDMVSDTNRVQREDR